jgi:hypothetical protein
MDATKGEFATAAPLIWDEMVFIGKAGADLGIRGEMIAFKAVDGEKIWGFYTVPSPDQTGGDTGRAGRASSTAAGRREVASHDRSAPRSREYKRRPNLLWRGTAGEAKAVVRASLHKVQVRPT